jgi:hypothetical protein
MSNSILPAAGNLDIVNAKVRADKFEATTSIGVSNTNPDFDLSVGTRFHVDKDSVDPVSVTGNVVASGIKISNLTISPTFDLAAVSNVGNTTSNTLQFANATTSFVASSNVEIGGNITLTSNAQVKVGSNVLAEYTGPHGREPKEMPLKKFPEIVFDASKLDGNDTTNTYVQAGYTVSSSSTFSNGAYPAWEAFNGIFPAGNDGGTEGWISSESPATYSTSATGGEYLATSQDTFSGAPSGQQNGSWIKIQLPKKIKLDHAVLKQRTGSAGQEYSKNVVIYASTNDSTWQSLGSFDASVSETVTFNTNSTAYYDYFVLHVKSVNQSYAYTAVEELEYYGTEEPAPPGDLSLDTTLKSTFNSVRSNNYVMYFDGEDPAAGNVPKYLPSGSAKSITPNNVVFDATNNCWTLDGSTESNVTTGSLGFEGDAPHTVSTWINASNLEANATTQQIFSIGPENEYQKEIFSVDNTLITANTWHNVTYAYQGEGGSKVTYVDGRKVAEAKVEDTFGEYPPFPLSDYSHGGIQVSASSELKGVDRRVYNAFNKDPINEGGTVIASKNWETNYAGYRSSSPYDHINEVSTTVGGTVFKGDWIQIKFPYELKLNYYDWAPQSTYGVERCPENVIVAGSNDLENDGWAMVASLNRAQHMTPPSYTLNTFTRTLVNSSGYYKYYRLIVTNLYAGTISGYRTLLACQELKLYGNQKNDFDRFPEPTRVLKYPHVVMTGPAQRGYVVSRTTGYLNRPGWYAFGGPTNWTSQDNYQLSGGTSAYNPSNGNVSSDDSMVAGGNTYEGDWIQLQLPHGVKFTSFKVSCPPSSEHASIHNRGIKNGILAGSNNGSSWDVLKIIGSGHVSTGSGLTWVTDETKTITIDTNTTTAYKYIRLLATAVQGGTTGGYWSIPPNGLEYFGTQEDTGTPAIVGGPFAGKVANFRVYDQYLGDERIQEIYDAQKDEFGHKKSSMTFYKGRIGVGTTEPEGALTVVDEPHTLEKFPSHALTAAYSNYSKNQGHFKVTTIEGDGYKAFDGLIETSWISTPKADTRLSTKTEAGAWINIETSERINLKNVKIKSRPNWHLIGGKREPTGNPSSSNFITGTSADVDIGRGLCVNHDGTRIILGAIRNNETGANEGRAYVYEFNGNSFVQIGNDITGTAGNAGFFGRKCSMSGGENPIIAITEPEEHTSGITDAGKIRVLYLAGSSWTPLPDTGSITNSGIFEGQSVSALLGQGGVKLSYDGTIIVMSQINDDNAGTNSGILQAYKYSNGAWTQRGTSKFGEAANEQFGRNIDMSEDGNHIIAASTNAAYVKVFKWDGSDYSLKGTKITHSSTGDLFGVNTCISNDGNVIAITIQSGDRGGEGALIDDGGVVHVYHYDTTTSDWVLKSRLHPRYMAVSLQFGANISMSGDGKRIVVAQAWGSAAIQTFEYNGESWVNREPPSIGAEGSAYLGYGANSGDDDTLMMSRDGSTIVVGNLDTSGGYVWVYGMTSTIKSVWGSNDNKTWTNVISTPTREEATSNVSGIAFRSTDQVELNNFNNTNYYKYHAIIGDAYTSIRDIKLYGIKEKGVSTLHDGQLTLTKNLDVPRIGPPMNTDNTPHRERLIVEFNTSINPMEDGIIKDTSGRNNNGAFVNGSTNSSGSFHQRAELVSYDSDDKSFAFLNDNDFISVDTGLTGNPQFSVSVWFKMIGNRTGTDTIFHMNGDYSSSHNQCWCYIDSSGNFKMDFYDNAYYVALAPYEGQWVHAVLTYNGDASSGRCIYINGVKLPYYTGGGDYGDALNLTNSSPMAIGALKHTSGVIHQYAGNMSNFKLYDIPLTHQDAKTLYDMGRTGSVANPKTLQIASSLDVRGRITREYYPGEVIEELHAVCASTSLRGKALIQNVTAYQSLSTGYADVTGSRVENYIIPKGTTNIVYEYSFHTKFEMQHAISHWKLFYKVGEGTWTEASQARMDVSATYYDMRQICRWVFEVGGTETASIGKLAAKAGDSFHVRWQARNYHANHSMTLHLTQYWDGGSGDQFSRPLVMIKAIA